jgi:hypothetical protein
VTSQATFSAQEKGLLSLDWGIEAQSRTIQTDVATNWDALALSLSTQQPWAMRQGTLTIASVAKKFKRVSFTVDNGILADDWFNSLNRAEMPSAMQTFTLTHDSPWDDADDVDALGAITEAAATLEFLSGTKRLYLEFPRLFTVNSEPGISGRERIMKPWQWRAKWIPGNAIDAPVKITVVGT